MQYRLKKPWFIIIVLHLRSDVGDNSKEQSLGNLYQGLWLGLLLICHIYYIKIWYEWWKGFVGVPNKSPKAKIPNCFNFFNFLQLSPQKSNICPRSGRDPQMFGFFWLKSIFAIFVVQQKKNSSRQKNLKMLKKWFLDPKIDVVRRDMAIIWSLWPFLCKKRPKLFLPWISTSDMTQNGQNLHLFWSF